MSLIISGTTATGVTLASGNSPVTITATGYLSNTGGNYALFGPAGTTWRVTNAGGIAGMVFGIYLKAPGTIVNKVTGSIGAEDTGIRGWGALTVVNAGYIWGYNNYGVGLQGGGAITNLSTGTIDGGGTGLTSPTWPVASRTRAPSREPN
jgi:hypothetical protein